jgi:hypothetical protein
LSGDAPLDPEAEQPLDLPAPRPDEIVPTTDSDAEELAFRLGLDLRAKKTSREIQKITRVERAHDHVHNMVVAAIYAVGFAALAMFVVLVWHFVTPWEFLTADKLNNIKQILFSGTLGAALSGVAKGYFGFGTKGEAAD